MANYWSDLLSSQWIGKGGRKHGCRSVPGIWQHCAKCPMDTCSQLCPRLEPKPSRVAAVCPSGNAVITSCPGTEGSREVMEVTAGQAGVQAQGRETGQWLVGSSTPAALLELTASEWPSVIKERRDARSDDRTHESALLTRCPGLPRAIPRAGRPGPHW